MWSDNESAVDLLRFTHLTESLIELIHEEALLPTTIGVFGDWGSGKSTILKHVETRLRSQDDGTICLTFNGWLFEGYEDAKSALMGNILEELEQQLKVKSRWNDKVGGAISQLLKRVNWLKVAKASASLAIPLMTGIPALGSSRSRSRQAVTELLLELVGEEAVQHPAQGLSALHQALRVPRLQQAADPVEVRGLTQVHVPGIGQPPLHQGEPAGQPRHRLGDTCT